MRNITTSGIAGWLQVKPVTDAGIYELVFDNRHIGNPFIRSLHGGVSAAMIEFCAEAEIEKQMAKETVLNVISSSIDYLRATQDHNLFARPVVQRISRRLAVVEVRCWQVSQDMPVAQGIVTLRVTTPG